jgi:di/tricarboxylate transporter
MWEVVFTIIVLVLMFGTLMTDRVGTDCVMLTALTAFYVSGIIDIKEALAGFSSQGLLTVLVLFVVAEGLNKTGALNWYIAKLLGRPRTLSGAQLRVMVPIAMLSGFVNDTPLVTVTLPIVIQWARKINVSNRFVLIPLSFAALLGGVCTLIGTSTNLVVAGLLQEFYPDNPAFQNMPLFALGQYGVPVALAGITYVILATPLLLARRGRGVHQSRLAEETEDILLPARLTQWSPAAGRTIQRSGLRDTGGIYLVRVKRQATGNVHHAVGPEFVIEAGDILYFTGLVEEFGEFCTEHGLQVMTNEVVENELSPYDDVSVNDDNELLPGPTLPDDDSVEYSDDPLLVQQKPDTRQKSVTWQKPDTTDIGITLESLLRANPQERTRVIYRMEDAIRNAKEDAPSLPFTDDKDRIVVAMDAKDSAVLIGIDTRDRSGLLLDVVKCLARLQLELHHTEAAVIGNRSLSVWRCEKTHASSSSGLEEIWSTLNVLLAEDKGVQAMKERGLLVVRARVLKNGRLVGTTAANIDFRKTYKAAIVAIQRDAKNVTESLSNVTFEAGDILVLQTSDDSPLLLSPPPDFYEKSEASNKENRGLSNVASGLFRSDRSRHGSNVPGPSAEADFDSAELGRTEDAESIKYREAVWNDLQVITSDEHHLGKLAAREFLTAMKVAPSSKLEGQTVAQAGIDKLPDIFLVSLERPVAIPDAGATVSSYTAVALSEPLLAGDVLWFSGTANSVGDLRKIPGLISYESDEVEKISGKVYDRRLVQAVVARKGPIVGKTVKELRFRTQYGAAVISVQREGQRVHEHPGNVKLRAGDVLLLEAGPSFMTNKIQLERSFALVADVQDSAPPRLRMLIPALILTAGAYACYVAGLSSLWGTAMCAAILMVALGILSENEARNAIRWEIYLTIASAFGIGTALVNSGVAGGVANFLVKIGNAVGLGNAGLLGAVYISTVLISQLVANNAAAALIFPIAMGAAEKTGTDLVLMSYTIMLAASAAFMTPFGYQTNLMVMGPGGYTTLDYLIFGTPMQIVLWIATTIFLVTPFWICWLATFVIFAAACAFRVLSDLKGSKQKAS